MSKTNIEVLDLITSDMKNDAESFDGRPFNGKVVAQYFGNQGAAIASLAIIIKAIVEGGGRRRRMLDHKEEEKEDKG